ncbi:MAG: arylsulfatase, partial [Planctomycetes bacterium]|nr:arylsulfatase [Planctomycetota bacterium]
GEGFYYTDAVSEAGCGFIVDTPADKPLFLYLAFTAPHWPLHAHQKDIDGYDGVYDCGWDAIRASRLARMKKMGIVPEDCRLSPRDRQVPPWSGDLKNRDVLIRRMQTYAAQIECMDRGIGRVVEQLKKSGRLDNTLFVFLADNGGCNERLRKKGSQRFAWPGQDSSRWGNGQDVAPGGGESFQSYGVGWANASNTPFRRYKKNSHEGGVATPLIVHWPRGIAAGRHGKLSRQPGHVIDIMATCVDVAGAPYPSEFKDHAITPLPGVSLAPALKGELLGREKPLFFEHTGHRAIRDGQWKLVKVRNRPWELYDLDADHSELVNLVKAQPARVKRMTRAWLDWAVAANVLTGKQANKERRP